MVRTQSRPKRSYATTAEVAIMLGVSESYVRKLASIGTIPAYRLGKLWRFDPAEIRQYISNQKGC